MKTIKQQQKFSILVIICGLLLGIFVTGVVSAAEKDFSHQQIKNEIKFNGVALKEALRSLAEMAELNVITDDSTVKGEVTAQLKNVSVVKAFKLLVKSRGLDYKIIENTISIGTREKLEEGFGQQVTRVYKLDNADPEKVKSNLSLLVEQDKIQINQRSNQLMIKTYKSKLPELEAAIEQLDQPRKQVVIQVRLEEISKGDLEELGIDWSFSNLKIDADQESEGTETTGGTDNEDGEESTSSTLEVGNVSLNYESVLNLLAQNNQSSTLANPRLTTVDGETATINIGESIPIVKESDENTEVEFKDVGINLEITPRITKEDEVYIEVSPEVSVVKEYLEAGDTKYPVIGTRKAETSVRIKHGQTIALGGLIKEEDVEKMSKVPFLGDLPILGELFKSKMQDTQKQELIIFLTPRIIDEQRQTRIEAGEKKDGIVFASYQVQKKDTIWQISQWFNVSFFEIISHNDETMIENLKPGAKLKIPVPVSHYYAVKTGDTLEKIARKYNLRVEVIKRINNVESLENVESLILPTAVDVADRIKQ